MKSILFLLLCALLIYIVPGEAPKCYDGTECHSSNYETYLSCVKRRYKRSTDCDSSCESGNCIDVCDRCDCDSCNYRNCHNSCNSCCSSCCKNYVPCGSNHCCHKTCQTQCKSYDCRKVCKNNCVNAVNKSEDTGTKDSRYNVTTVIHLNNVINNTNIIDIPIVVNNTNQHNITLYNEAVKAPAKEGKCCEVISPRQCAPQSEYPFFRCFHYRSRQCGNFCTSAIVHKEQQQVCQSVYPGANPNCYQQIVYIPQPQPRCTYQSVWPYVTCRIQSPASCEGCYNHYFNGNSRNYLSCSYGCYDDGFGAGPYYRQGPFYRPGYSHMPCFGMNPGYGAGAGFGGFGFPGVGFPPPPPVFPGFPGQALPGMPQPVVPAALGSWVPGFENFGQPLNASRLNGPFDTLISFGPGLQNLYNDPMRGIREVEIEVNYQQPISPVQAEVAIKTDEAENKTDTTVEDSSFTTPNSIAKEVD